MLQTQEQSQPLSQQVDWVEELEFAGQHLVSWVVLQPARGGRAPWGQTSCPTYLRERSDQKYCTELNHNERKGDYLLTAELENAFMLTARSWPMGGGDKSLDAASSSELPGRKWAGSRGTLTLSRKSSWLP